MTLPLAPAPRLSATARPIQLAPSVPDLDQADRMFGNGASGPRELVERELLGHAMSSPIGVRALRQLDPAEFSTPTTRHVAQAILDLADAGQPHDAAAVTAELRRRPLFDQADGQNTQLPRHLDPTVGGRRADPRVTGLGAWQTGRFGPPEMAWGLAQEVRSAYRQERGVEAAKRAAAAYGGALERGTGGRLEGDHVGAVTKDLADLLVSIPRTLPIPPIEPQTDMRMPEPPMLSPAGRAALRAG